jgi:hypothetical protein
MIYKNGKCLAYAVLLSTFVLTFSFLFQSFAFGQQDVKISPSCGPESGFNFDIIASGFTPNTNVNWQIMDSDENKEVSF